MNKQIVSIIVPAYNVEKYLPECIDSILRQTYADFELILVDDGSSDSSGRVCDEYAKCDSRIRVLHQQNGGVTRARAAGVEAAKGEWVCFVDGDDTIPKDSIKNLMSATGSMTDIVIASCDDRKFPENMTLEEYRRDCIAGRKVHSGPFARAFRASLFSSHVFDIPREVVRGEDLIMNVRLAFASDKAPVFLDKKVYNYRINDTGVMQTFHETFEHMKLFQEHLQVSVPTAYTQLYQHDLLYSKVGSLVHYAIDNVGNKSYLQTPYYKQLREEMKVNCVHFTFEQKMMLAAKTPFQLRMAYRLIHIWNMLCKK